MYDQFLTSDDIITVKAKMPDGTEYDTHWKKCQHVDYERWLAAERSGDIAKIERSKQIFIATCLVNPDGSKAMDAKESIKLTAEGVQALFPAALKACGLMVRQDPKGDTPDGDASM